MYADVSEEVTRLLDETQRTGSCLAATSPRLRKALETRRAAYQVISPCPRLYARPAWWRGLTPTARTLARLRGLHALHPRMVFCGVSAAVAHGLSVSYRLQGQIHVAVGLADRGRSSAWLRRHPLDAGEPVMAGGVPVTPLDRTVLDCTRWLDFREGLAVADSALRVSGMPHGQLVEYVARHRSGLRGAPQARATAAFADARSANGGESIARAVMDELGFRTPDLQVPFADPVEPGILRFADYAWGRPGERPLVGELDGADKYFDVEMTGSAGTAGALLRERRRESRLTLSCGAVLRFSMDEVYDTALFEYLVAAFGVPRDRGPRIAVPRLRLVQGGAWVPAGELVPVEAYEVA